MVAPYIDPALGVLRAQIKKKHPKAVVYWIGDPDHQDRPSDHNPEADGSVDAIDVMIANIGMAGLKDLAKQLIDSRDFRISYLILDGRIISSTVKPWVWRDYTGSDQHTDHLHISRNDKSEASTAPWNIYQEVEVPRVATQFNAEDKAVLQTEAKEGVTELTVQTPFSSGGGAGSVIGGAVLNSDYPARPNATRTHFWNNLQNMQVDIDEIKTTGDANGASLAAIKEFLLDMLSDPSEGNNPLVEIIQYAINNNPAAKQ